MFKYQMWKGFSNRLANKMEINFVAAWGKISKISFLQNIRPCESYVNLTIDKENKHSKLSNIYAK